MLGVNRKLLSLVMRLNMFIWTVNSTKIWHDGSSKSTPSHAEGNSLTLENVHKMLCFGNCSINCKEKICGGDGHFWHITLPPDYLDDSLKLSKVLVNMDPLTGNFSLPPANLTFDLPAQMQSEIFLSGLMSLKRWTDGLTHGCIGSSHQ